MITLINNTIVQLAAICMLNSAYLVYLCKVRPYKERKDNTIIIAQELLVVSVSAMFIAIRSANTSHSSLSFLGLIVIVLILSDIFIVFLIELFCFIT